MKKKTHTGTEEEIFVLKVPLNWYLYYALCKLSI